MACFYCGDELNLIREHIIPCAYLDYRTYTNKENLYQCCAECNGTIGSKVFFEDVLKNKLNIVEDYYKRKYRKVLKSPYWTEEELEELKPSLKTAILATQLLKERVHRKLATIALRRAWLSQNPQQGDF